MGKAGLKSSFLIITLFVIYTCIDPYTPNLSGYKSLLVVDGLITDAGTSCSVRLTRTVQNQNDTPSQVNDATIFITDDSGISAALNNAGNGTYKTDSLNFRGSIGRIYVLHIKTSDGSEYESEPCEMKPVPDIDNIYYEKDEQLVNNGTQSQQGLSIYLDSKKGDFNSFYRWNFDETWKFRVPYPKKYDYIEEKDPDSPTILPVKEVKEFCWKNSKSDAILIRSVYQGQSAQIVKQPLFFIATDQSDRFMLEYSMLVSQYSLSKNEYEFWDNLTKINAAGSDIFASQPYSVISNIRNINNPKERVMGYFQVSAVKQKRIFIPFSEIARLQLPFYHYDCTRIEQSHSFVKGPPPPPYLTWNEIYSIYCITSNYSFVEAVYKPDSLPIYRLIFTRPVCADCELTGTMKKPDFWIDLK